MQMQTSRGGTGPDSPIAKLAHRPGAINQPLHSICSISMFKDAASHAAGMGNQPEAGASSNSIAL